MKIFSRVLSVAATVCIGLGVFTVAAAEAETEDEKVYGDMTYVSYEDHIAITKYRGPENAGRVIVPEKIDGLPVTEIGGGAFIMSSIKSISLPDSIKSIKNSAFSSSSISEIDIPEGVTAIDSTVFNACANLKRVGLPSGLKSIGTSAFNGCESLEAIDIPDGVERINSNAFYGCSSLEEVTIPNSVTRIDSSAFFNCSSLDMVVIENPSCSMPRLRIFSNGSDENGSSYFNGTIYGYEDSTAQEHATKFNLNFALIGEKLKGDLNYDGIVDTQDVVIMKKYLVGLSGLTNSQCECADMNDDEIVNVFDLIFLKRAVM